MVVQKTVVVGAGPVGALAAIYAARRGDEVEIYELRNGMEIPRNIETCHASQSVVCIFVDSRYVQSSDPELGAVTGGSEVPSRLLTHC